MILKCTKRSDLKRSAQGKEIVPLTFPYFLLLVLSQWRKRWGFVWSSNDDDEKLYNCLLSSNGKMPEAEKLCRSVMSEIDQNGDPPLHTPYTVIKQWPTRVGLSFLQPDPASSSSALFRFSNGQNTFSTFFFFSFSFFLIGVSRWWRCCWDWGICFGWVGFGDGGWLGVFDG